MDINIETRLQQLETLAWRMENLIPIPGTDLRFGLDAVVGMVPVVGDFAALLPGVYIMKAAHDLGASRRMLIRMGLNLAVDVVIGLVPGIGDLFDVAWNANTRNVALLRARLETQTAHTEWARAAVAYDPACAGGAEGAA